MVVKNIVSGGLSGPNGAEEFIRKGIEYSLNFWLQLPIYGTDATYKYIYPELQEILDNGDLYSISSAYASSILFNELMIDNPEFTGNNDESYLKIIYQQRWLDLFRQANEAWNLARRTMDSGVSTPTTIDHKKLVTYRLPYPQSEITYNTDNYNEQVNKMVKEFGSGDTRQTKVWWMK